MCVAQSNLRVVPSASLLSAIVVSSLKWSQVSLLSFHNLVFSHILAHILKLNAQFLDNLIKILIVDNVTEFTSKTFEDFYASADIDIARISDSSCSLPE